jgi:hypothetical protein
MAAVKRNPAPFSLLGHSGPLKAQQELGWGYVGCVGPQERHLYSRINFKLNRAAALFE